MGRISHTNFKKSYGDFLNRNFEKITQNYWSLVRSETRFVIVSKSQFLPILQYNCVFSGVQQRHVENFRFRVQGCRTFSILYCEFQEADWSKTHMQSQHEGTKIAITSSKIVSEFQRRLYEITRRVFLACQNAIIFQKYI